MEITQDSMILLTTGEYKHLREQQAYYFTVNKDIRQQNENYFKSGYHIGGFYGTILGMCIILVPIIISKLKHKQNGAD